MLDGHVLANRITLSQGQNRDGHMNQPPRNSCAIGVRVAIRGPAIRQQLIGFVNLPALTCQPASQPANHPLPCHHVLPSVRRVFASGNILKSKLHQPQAKIEIK